MKKYLKKSLSLVMAALMLMSCWVFFAPTKAEAVNAGNYYYKIVCNFIDTADGWDKGDLTLTGISNNGQGTSNQIIEETGMYVTGSTGDKEWVSATSTDKFPTKLTYEYQFGGGFTFRSMAGTLKLYVGSSSSKLDLLAEQHFSAKSSAFKAAKGTVTLTVPESKYPKANEVVFDANPGTINAPGTNNSAHYHLNDQYGVRVSSVNSSPSVSVTSNKTIANGSLTVTNDNSNGSYSVATINATEGIKQTDVDSQTGTLSVSYTFNGVTKSGSKTFTINDPKYTFSFDGNGGSISPNAAINKYYYNEIAASEIPSSGTRTGYEFIGMYTDKRLNYDGSKPTAGTTAGFTDNLKGGTKIDANRTYYAAWWAKNVNVTFVDNAGNDVENGTYDKGKYDKTFSGSGLSTPVGPAYDSQTTGTFDYVFDHWEVLDAKDINGNDISGAYGTNISDYILKGDTTFRAVYTAKQKSYTVEFLNEDGTQRAYSNAYTYRDTPNTNGNPTKSADNYFTYTFKGWHKVADGEQKKGYVVNSDGYLSTSATSDEADGGFIGVASDITVRSNAVYVPVFEKTYIDYTVNFEYKDALGNTVTTEAKTYHFNEALETPTVPESYTSSGYRYAFTGWNTDGGAMPTVATENKKYIAQYGDPIAAEYKVTFTYMDANGVEQTVEQTVKHNEAITAPAHAEKYRDESNEYTFTKWLDQYGKEITAKGEKDADYVAQYDASALHTVTFYNEGEQYGEVLKYVQGETIITPDGTPEKAADLTASKYTFIGWQDKNDAAPGVMGEEDLVFEAKYDPTYIDYTVNFVWKNENGEDVTETKTYHYADEIAVPEEYNLTYKDNTYTYTFKAWDKDILTHCIEDVTYTATYRKSYNYYNVTWLKEDNIVDYEIGYDTYLTNAFIYNERISMPTQAPRSVQRPVGGDGFSMVLDHWEYFDEAENAWKLLDRNYRVTKDIIVKPIYREEAKVCTVKLYDEAGTALIQTVEIAYGTAIADCETVGIPKKAYSDDSHFEFSAWVKLDGTAFDGTITEDCSLKATYEEKEHTYGDVVADKLPTFFETGLGTQTCTYCGKEKTGVVIDMIPDNVAPTSKLFIKGVTTESGEDVDTTKEIMVAPLSDLIIATVDSAEESAYNKEKKGSGVGKIAYYVSFNTPVANDELETQPWITYFDYDEYVAAMKDEGLSDSEIALAMNGFEANATAYVRDLNKSYELEDGDVFYFYAKITDRLGNVNYVGSNKLIYDTCAPEVTVTGGGNGSSKFCVEAVATATDEEGLASFTVNGEDKLAEAETGVTLNTAGTYQVVAVDEAGNKTTKNITIVGEHREKLYTTAATCTEDGSVVKRCTLCGEQIGEATVLEKTGHNFVKIKTVEPTCIKNGYDLERCTYCGETQQTNIVEAKGEHTFGEWITEKDATCIAEGSRYHICSVCGTRETEATAVDENAHKFYRAVTIKPTCTKGGYSEHTCKYCAKTFTIEGSETNALKHEASGVWVVTKEASCKGKDAENVGEGIVGERVQYCARDGASDCDKVIMKTEAIPAPNHAFKYVQTVKPTGTEEGYTLYECMVCGEQFKMNYVDKLVEHTVTFVDENGTTVLAKVTKYTGEAVAASEITEPTKAADNTYKYTFSGWVDEEGKSVTLPVAVGEEDITLKATYESRYINYTITFYKGDTQFKRVGYLHYGNEVPTTTTPSDYEDKYNTYTFAGWVKVGAAEGTAPIKTITVTGDADYYAAYTATAKVYNVTFAYNYTDIIDTFKVNAGANVAYYGTTPVKASDENFHYSFKGWKGDSLLDITKDTLAIAEFESTLHDFKFTEAVKEASCTESGSATYTCSDCRYVETRIVPALGHSWSTETNDKGEYVCTICNETKDSGIRYEVKFYTEGDADLVLVRTIGYLKKNAVLDDSQIPTPTKASTATKSYVFKGWYKKGDETKTAVEVEKTITANAEYVAIFEETERTFTVIYAVDSDNVLQVIKNVKGGATLPAYTGETPTSDEFDDYSHKVFYGWDKEDSDFPNGITGDVYITAVFTSENHKIKSVSMHGATCTKPMTENFKCEKCEYTYTKTTGKANGHKYTLVETLEPTATTAGYEKYRCSVCGDEYTKNLEPKTYIFFTVIVNDQDNKPVQGAKVSLFDGKTFVASGTTDSNGKVTFRVEEAKTYRVVVEYDSQHLEGDVTVNPDGSTSGGSFNVNVSRCSCTCHRDGVWPSIFRFFHKIIKMLVGHFVCCGEPDARYGS